MQLRTDDERKRPATHCLKKKLVSGQAQPFALFCAEKKNKPYNCMHDEINEADQ